MTQVYSGPTLTCPCGQDFYVIPARAGTAKYCSKACMYRFLSETMRGSRQGKANPNFKHGKKAGWQLRGWSLAEKGETCCRHCGQTEGNIALHHAVPRSICPPDAKRDLRNGIALCQPCHAKWHRGSLVLTRDIFTDAEWDYISSLKITGRDTSGWLDKHYPPTEELAA